MVFANKKSGFVYLIRNKDLYKIGITNDVDRRMKVLKPDEIIKVLKIKEYKTMERKLHQEYKDSRIPQTEYFRLNRSQLENCKKKLSISYYRRSKCNPYFIALIVTLISPYTCLIWAIRHKSQQLTILVMAAIVMSNHSSINIKSYIERKVIFNSSIGVLSFLISNRNKTKALS